MKTFSLLLFLFFPFALTSYAQHLRNNDSVIVQGSAMGGLRFFQDSLKLNMSQLTDILHQNPEAYTYLKKAKGNIALSFILSFAGGFMIGWELGSSISGKGINWGVMGGGLGAIGLSIPFATGAKRNLKKGVDIYNASLH